MTLWEFDLIVEGRDLTDPEAINQIWHSSRAAEGEFYPGWRDGVQRIGFFRQARLLDSAVLDAILQVESLGGVFVVGVSDESYVTIPQLANRSSRPQRAIEELVKAARNDDDFPSGVTDPETGKIEWRWLDIAQWFFHRHGETLDDPNRETYRMLASFLDVRRRVRGFPSELRSQFGRLFLEADDLQPVETSGSTSMTSPQPTR